MIKKLLKIIPISEVLQSPEHSSLINPSLIEIIKHPSGSTRWIASEAKVEGELAALAVAEIFPLNRIAKLHSLTIKENFTGRGIWRPLFTFMQDHLVQDEKIRALEWTYDQASPSAPAMERILASLGWAAPQLYLVRFHFDEPAFDPPWISRPFPLPRLICTFFHGKI